MTDIELQQRLAAKLPGLIKYSGSLEDHTGNGFVWLDTRQSITPREWNWIVDEILLQGATMLCFPLNFLDKWPTMSWQQRAQVLCENGVI